MLEKIKEIIAEHADVKDVQSLTMETNLLDLGLDSLDGIEILMELEEEFDIEVSDDAFGKVKTLGDIVYYIEVEINR